MVGAGKLNPGDFWWSDLATKPNGERHGRLIVAFPPREGLGVLYEIHSALCATDGSESGEPRLWDGDLDRPTVAGSWGVDHFHCWVHRGVMTLTNPNK